jgi:hypothetical protein
MVCTLSQILLGSSRPGRFTPEKRSRGTHWIGDWFGPRAGLDTLTNRKILA